MGGRESRQLELGKKETPKAARLWTGLSLVSLAISLGDIVTVPDNEVLEPVVMATAEVAVEDALGALGVADLSIDRGTGHVGNHGIATTPWALDIAERMVLGSRLGEPNVTSITTEVAGLDGFSNVLLDDNGAAGGIDEPSALLHLGDEVLVEETKGLLVERAVDGDNVTLSEHLLEALDTTAANLLLNLRRERLVVVVEELLAVEWLQAAQNTLANATDGDGSNNLALEVILVLSDSSDIPVTVTNLVVGGNEVADQGQDGHDDVLGNGDDIATSDLGDGDTAVGLVGSIQVDVVRADTSSDGELQVLGLGQTVGGQIAGVEGSRNDDLSVNKLLLEGGVRTLLIGGGDEGVALVLEPLAQAELVLDSSQKTGLLLGVLTAVIQTHKNFTL